MSTSFRLSSKIGKRSGYGKHPEGIFITFFTVIDRKFHVLQLGMYLHKVFCRKILDIKIKTQLEHEKEGKNNEENAFT